MRVEHEIGLSFRADRPHHRAQVDRLDAARGEILEKEVVFRSPSAVLRPKRKIVLVDGGRVRRDGDEKADAFPGESVAHGGEESDRLRHPLVAQNEPRALTHHFVALVEHPPVAADQGAGVHLEEDGMGEILMQADHRVAQAEVILEKGVDLAWKGEPGRQRRNTLRRGRQPAPLLVDVFRAVRADRAPEERRREQEEANRGEPAPIAKEHAGSDHDRDARPNASECAGLGRRR